MIAPKTRVSQSRTYTLLPDVEGNIPLQEITDLIVIARRAYHREVQQLASSPDWLKFRIGTEVIDGSTVVTLEAFYDVETTEEISAEDQGSPDQLVLPLVLHNQEVSATPIRRSFPTQG